MTSIHPALIGSLNPLVPDEQLINFSPGPTSLPKTVEDEIKALFCKPGLTSLALSHRSPEFIEILQHSRELVREVMAIPEDYEVLFMHGGGHGQFAAVPLNLCKSSSDVACYVVNGTWTARARDEAQRYCAVQTIDGSDTETGDYTTFPMLRETDIDPESKYVFVCSNETVNGVELLRLPKLPESRRHIPLVVDASSDLTTKPIDWVEAGVGVLFACASKNIGHPGVTLVVVRKDLIAESSSPLCPGFLNYKTNLEAENLWNTPATFNIEVIGLVMEWVKRNGGVAANEKRSIEKAEILYSVIDASDGFYGTPEISQDFRSRMNIPFNVSGGSEELTNQFLIESWSQGIVGLRTLTPFGYGKYLRASLYNGITVSQVKRLANFMVNFANDNIERLPSRTS